MERENFFSLPGFQHPECSAVLVYFQSVGNGV